MKRVFFPVLTALLLLSVTAGCGPALPDERETAFQVSTIDAILDGVYDGVLSYGELKEHGDFGIGTFNGLDGEAIGLDGVYYQIKADGNVYAVPDDATTPFAVATFFDADRSLPLPIGLDFAGLAAYLDGQLPTENIFYAVRIDGTFDYVKTRSVPGQTKPYPPLTEVTAHQPEFEMHNVSGTIIGFRCPPYVSGVNVVGYHLHFITEDRDAGGHVLDFTLGETTATVDDTANFVMLLPGPGSDFYRSDLSKDRSGEVEQAEK
jgi:acetolactate decarboxylase